MGLVQKSLVYLKYTLRLWNSNIDKAILYNNLARIYLILNDFSASLKANKLCLDIITNESNFILKERIKNSNFNLLAENKNKIELISFLFYNYGFFCEKMKIEDESYLVYKRGFEFSLSTLGDMNILTNKFRPKLNYNRKITKSIHNFSDLRRRRSLDSKYDSDIDYNSINDVNIGLPNYIPRMKLGKKVLNSKYISPITNVKYLYNLILFKIFIFIQSLIIIQKTLFDMYLL